MGAQVVDYRISTLVVLCKDCGNDVGLYPARHKCQPVDRPAMPALPAQFIKNKTEQPQNNLLAPPSLLDVPKPSFGSNQSNKGTIGDTEDNEESVYFNNFAANLPEQKEQTGKKLWGKIRENEKWKQLNEKNEKPKQSGKLWGKLIQATQNVADKIPNKDERGAESDEDDWDGETHVSRILREYYESKRMRLPEWLFEDDPEVNHVKKSVVRNSVDTNTVDVTKRNSTRRRLWDQNPSDAKSMSSRERERQELRQAPSSPPPPSSIQRHDDRVNNHFKDEDSAYREDRRNYEDERPTSNRYRNEGRREYENDNPYPPSSRDYSNDRYMSQGGGRDDYYRHENYRRDEYRRDDYRREPQPYPSLREQQPRYPEDGYRSSTQQQAYGSNRQHRLYDESDSYYSADSRSSARGYHESSYKKDDYYYTNDSRQYAPSSPMDRGAARYNQPPPPDSSRRAPSLRGTRRYGNDHNYF
ncbi:hypothetical protein A0J61_07049 [Choanephora cucurbitarum]|uniref:Mso1 N-terminal domain-containing protein n=1 Tax=Choanephora cucurbitarum TaxID=101091 RepID=A0A1C7N8D2_9FUNG|nr:hypothetical protein A0J61_07049 [Choanephora cucurbitarum]